MDQSYKTRGWSPSVSTLRMLRADVPRMDVSEYNNYCLKLIIINL
jgi:hypothetical protein